MNVVAVARYTTAHAPDAKLEKALRVAKIERTATPGSSSCSGNANQDEELALDCHESDNHDEDKGEESL